MASKAAVAVSQRSDNTASIAAGSDGTSSYVPLLPQPANTSSAGRKKTRGGIREGTTIRALTATAIPLEATVKATVKATVVATVDATVKARSPWHVRRGYSLAMASLRCIRSAVSRVRPIRRYCCTRTVVRARADPTTAIATREREAWVANVTSTVMAR